MELTQLAGMLVAIGCPEDKSQEMASQLNKRAHQLAARKQTSHEEALLDLLSLMRQGWAAKERGL